MRKYSDAEKQNMPRCHHCGDVVDVTQPYFKFEGNSHKLYWHAQPRQCMGKDIVYIVLTVKGGVT